LFSAKNHAKFDQSHLLSATKSNKKLALEVWLLLADDFVEVPSRLF
jgi:hypothetical protein